VLVQVVVEMEVEAILVAGLELAHLLSLVSEVAAILAAGLHPVHLLVPLIAIVEL